MFVRGTYEFCTVTFSIWWNVNRPNIYINPSYITCSQRPSPPPSRLQPQPLVNILQAAQTFIFTVNHLVNAEHPDRLPRCRFLPFKKVSKPFHGDTCNTYRRVSKGKKCTDTALWAHVEWAAVKEGDISLVVTDRRLPQHRTAQTEHNKSVCVDFHKRCCSTFPLILLVFLVCEPFLYDFSLFQIMLGCIMFVTC